MKQKDIDQAELFEAAKKEVAKEAGKRGGEARARNLSKAERSEIASRGAAARWSNSKADDIPLATHAGVLVINDGGIEIPCAVLPDGTRVLSERGIMAALEMPRIGRQHAEQQKAQQSGGPILPRYLAFPVLKPYISNELLSGPFERVLYRVDAKNVTHFGVKAEAIPVICDIWLKARSEGALRTSSQFAGAFRSEILVRALAKVGIVALVDEATGYQYDRGKKALAEILQKFISDEMMRWVKTFSDEFYKQIFRLRGWDVRNFSERPGIVGKWTVDLVYQRLAPGVLEELKRVTPRGVSGRYKHRLHQHLTLDYGYIALMEHISAVVTMMQLTEDGDWDGFYRKLNRLKPRLNATLELFPSDVELEKIPEKID
jgi:general stress protein YciG